MRDELARLLRHSAIYGLAGLASRIASVLLLPFLTRELGPSSYGRIETMVALIALLVPLLRAGVATAFFRFYYERELAPDRDLVVRTSFWFTVLGAGVGLVVGLRRHRRSLGVVGDDAYANLVRVAFVMLAVQLLYEQLTALYRVEERSVAFTVASLANLAITVVATIVAVFVLDDGATGALAGNAFGTAVVLVVLIWQRRAALRPAFDRDLVRQMNRFGLPLLPAGLAIWVVDFADRLLLGRIVDQHEVGLYAVGVKIASAMVLVQLAFRTAWPAFAYSLEEGIGGAADVRLRADVHLAARLLVVARARAAGAVAGRSAGRAGVRPGRARGGAARLLRRAAGRVHDAVHRRLARQPHGPLLAGRRRGRRGQRRPQPAADPDVRHGGRRRRDGRRLRGAGGRHGVARAAALPGAVRVAPADDRRRRSAWCCTRPAGCSTCRSLERSR